MLLIFEAHGSAKAQAQLQGKILDEKTLQPIPGVKVHARYLPSQYNTNNNGFFKLEHLPLGEIELLINKVGYSTVTVTTKIKAGINPIVIKLPPQELPQLTPLFRELNLFREKVVIVTDKPYYYPGEVIWLKAFMNYFKPELKDSLSRVVYLDFLGVNEKNKTSIIARHILSLDSGRFEGSILVPDELKPGNYMLRAHTSFMRNFGEDQFFYKCIPILNTTDRIPAKNMAKRLHENLPHKIMADKEIYESRSPVNLEIEILNSDKAKIEGALCVSVTDISQVTPIQETNLVDVWGFDEGIDKVSAIEFSHVVERGVRFVGHFVSEYQTGKKVLLSVFTKDILDAFEFETDEKGWFQVNGLKFYDSTTFYYTAKRGKKGDVYNGTIQMESEEIKLNSPSIPGFWFQVDTTKVSQRALATYLAPPEVRMLDEVSVSATRLESAAKRGIPGGADRVFKAETLNNYSNVLLSLQNKMPGLTVNCNVSPCQVRVARGGASGGSWEPTVLINNIPIGGPAGVTLQSINVNSVERIEIRTRPSVLYGSVNGIIAVYLKDGHSFDSNFKGITPSFELKGFTRPMKFVSPDYQNPDQETSMSDFRSTLYWNPELRRDAASGNYKCRFFTSDLPGKYRIVVQGVTSDHQPVWAEKVIEVK